MDALRNVLFASGPLREAFVQFNVQTDLAVVAAMALVLVAATVGFKWQA